MSKMRVFLLAGHDQAGDCGALGVGGLHEADLTVEQRDRIATILRAAGAVVFTDLDSHGLNDTIRWVNANANANDLVVDLHFNAASATATGVEVFRHMNASAYWQQQCAELSADLAAALRLFDRGQKSENYTRHWRLGILHTNGGREVLVETCFITNERDVQKYRQHMQESDQAIANWILRQVAADNAADETRPQ